MKKYQVISYHPIENGYDEKCDWNTLAEAKKECKQLLYHDNPDYRWYEKMFIVTATEVVMVFDEYHHNGRKPYSFETEKFTFRKQPEQLALSF
jgi:hypothetical protein